VRWRGVTAGCDGIPFFLGGVTSIRRDGRNAQYVYTGWGRRGIMDDGGDNVKMTVTIKDYSWWQAAAVVVMR
jgi:hypothetical protein